MVTIFPVFVLHRLLLHCKVPDQAFIESMIEEVFLPLVFAGSTASLHLDSPLPRYDD
jgi:hypothetical protein